MRPPRVRLVALPRHPDEIRPGTSIRARVIQSSRAAAARAFMGSGHGETSRIAPGAARMNAVPPPETAHRYRAVFISDLHLGTRGARTDFLADFLRRM